MLYKNLFSFFLLLFAATSVNASVFYVATNGSDENTGSIHSPFATIQKAQEVVQPGDTVYLRGGTYQMTEAQVARKEKIWAYVTYLNKSGAAGKPINYWAYPGEHPVFNYAAIKPAGLRITAFHVSASWLHIKGLEITGVQVSIKTHTQSECFENMGSNNIYELLNMHDGMAIGIYLLSGSNNLFLNCDAYNNYDSVSENGRGGNTDGFGCHPSKGSTNNVFSGCRAWFNSDDGYDVIGAHESVTFENCLAFYNGYSTAFKSLGDGNGFKNGGYGKRNVEDLPATIPWHTVKFCVAVANKANGFYSNHHISGSNWFNNIAYRNGVNFNLLNRLKDNVTDVPGYDHILRNNISYKGGKELENIDTTTCTLTNNFFDIAHVLTDKDFMSVDETLLTAPRKAGGDLPENNFLKPTNKGLLKNRVSVLRMKEYDHLPVIPQKKKLLFADNFSKPLNANVWVVEQEAAPNSTVYVKNNSLLLDTRKGVTVWLNKMLEGDLIIEFDRTILVDTGQNDRLSDMNIFWMATDPKSKKLFGRDGVFESYDSLSLYYAGIGGNTNKTTRFRKYEGDGKKPILKEFTDAQHLLAKNKEYHVTIVVNHGNTGVWIDDECYFSFTDPQPLAKGYFGFRSTWSRQQIKNFKVFR